MKYKNPESILAVIFCTKTLRCLMLHRKDYLNFWQSVTGSLEFGENPMQTAIREVKEETGIDILAGDGQLIDADYSVDFDILPAFLHRYAPGTKTNKEHWFYLSLDQELTPVLTEHVAYQWLPIEVAANLTLSPNNAQAILGIYDLIKP